MVAKSRRILVVCGAVALAITVGAIGLHVRYRPFKWTCTPEGKIPTPEREAIERAALELVGRATGADPASAYALFATSARQAGLTVEQLVATNEQQKQQFGPISGPEVARVYLAELTGATGSQQIVCGSIGQVEDRVLVTANAGPAQAHVLVEGQSSRGLVALAIWMVAEAGEWRVLEFHARLASYMGKTAAEFEEMAKAEQQEGHLLNAALLFSQAQGLADRGPRMQLGILPRIVDELQAVKVPGPLAGALPFVWNVGGAQFKILSVTSAGLDDGNGSDKLWVIVQHEIDPWVDDAFAERMNRGLITAFRKRYPSYKNVFAGLAMRAQQKDSGQGVRMFGTVHREDDGANEASSANEPQ